MSDSNITTVPASEVRFGPARPKVPAFARYRGTSAWRKDRVRARAYARFRRAEKLAAQAG